MPAKVIRAVWLERDNQDCTRIAVNRDDGTELSGEGVMWGLAAALGFDVGQWTNKIIHLDLTPENPPDGYDPINF